MTSLFDGMGKIVTGVLGAPVTVTPPGGLPRDIEAMFREGPRLVQGPDGFDVQTVLPTLTGLQSDLADIVPGGIVDPGNGRTYKATGWMPSGSPAGDALAEAALERLAAHA